MVRNSSSRCKKCLKIKHETELKVNGNGVGLVCIDIDTCKEQQIKTSASGIGTTKQVL